MTVKEVDISNEVLYIDWFVKVGGVLALVVATIIAIIIMPYCTRFRTTKFYTIRFYAASEAIGKGIDIHRCDFGFYWLCIWGIYRGSCDVCRGSCDVCRGSRDACRGSCDVCRLGCRRKVI